MPAPIDLPSPHTLPLGARRWKLFLLVVVVLASLTTAAIVLTLRAHPHRGTLHAPAPQPVARAIFLPPDHQNPAKPL